MTRVDTTGLLSALDASEPQHARSARALIDADPPRLLSPFVLAELDYLLATRVSSAAAIALLPEVARGAYQLDPMPNMDIGEPVAVPERHADRGLGLPNAQRARVHRAHGASYV